MADIPLATLAIAAAITFFAGFVKGAVGFAMPMIMISGLGSILSAETALAALILPTVFTNVWQSFRDGAQAAFAVVRRFWLYIAMMLAFLASSAQLVNLIPTQVMYLIIGLPILGFALFQLAGGKFQLNPETRVRDEAMFGAVSGFVGGFSGVWGPPLVAYLVAIGAEKREAVRVQGVLFALGAIVLFAAHLRSGLLNAQTLPISAWAVLPAFAGLGLGVLLHDRMPQKTFRRAVLVVLVAAGLNLIRRGLIG